MDTTRSDHIVQNFLKKEEKFLRKVSTMSETLKTTSGQVFPLLCPTREADWIPGWHPELIYTNSGYAEENCVFRTKKSHSMNSSTWIFTDYKPNKYIKFVKIDSDIIQHCRIDLVQNSNETITITFKTISTALNLEGNKILEKTKDHSDSNPIFKLMKTYLENGEMISGLNPIAHS